MRFFCDRYAVSISRICPSGVRRRSCAHGGTCAVKAIPAGCRGFTLIELLLAVTIFAMLIGVLFGSFRVGISAWQGGERDVVFQQSVRAATEMIFREIKCTHAYSITQGSTETAEDFSAFFGSEDSLVFVTKATLQSGIGGLSLIELWVDDENGLMLAEAPALFTSYDEMNDINLRTDEYAGVLSAWVKKISFRYFKREDEDDDGVWQEQWDPRTMDEYDLPLVVEVSLLFEDVRGREIEHLLLVPIMGRPL